jgi:hypothetical protein
MQQAPIEIQIQILNHLVFFFDPTIKNENEYYEITSHTYSSQRNEEDKENLFSNIRSLCSLSQVNKHWYELIYHQRMHRLWKCVFVQLGGDVTELSYMNKTKTKTLTRVVYNNCKKTYPILLYQRKRLIFINAIVPKYKYDELSVNMDACIKVFEKVDWIIDEKKNEFMDFIYTMLIRYHIWEVIQLIAQKHEHLLTYGTFYRVVTEKNGTRQFISIIENMKKENVDKIFEKLDGDTLLISTLQNTTIDDFKLISPYICKYYNSTNLDICDKYKDVIMKHRADIVGRLECIRMCIGDENFSKVSLLLVKEICVTQAYYFSDASYQLVDSLIAFLISIKDSYIEQQYSDSLLHQLFQLRAVTFPQFPKLLLKYKNVFAPMTIKRNKSGKIPIEEFIESFTVRGSSYYFWCMNESSRLAIIDVLFSICPDVQIYKKQKVGVPLTTMITRTGDDKKKYTKYLQLL